MPFVGAALLKVSLVGSFSILGEGREYLGWHFAGGVCTGVVEGADRRMHMALEGGGGGQGPVCVVDQTWNNRCGITLSVSDRRRYRNWAR